MAPRHRSSTRAVVTLLAVMAAATAVFIGALLNGRRTAQRDGRQVASAPPSAAVAGQPSLGSTVFAPSTVLNADITGSIPESPTEAEWFVRRIAFIGDSNDIAFTVNKSFPNPPALYKLAFDDGNGAYAATATALAGLGDKQRGYLNVAGQATVSGVVASIQSWDLDDPGRSVTAPRGIFHVSADGETVTDLTEGCCMIDGFALTPDGTAVLGINNDGDLVRIDLATRQRTTLASGLKTPSGGSGGTYDVSADGRWIALGTEIAPSEAAVRILDSATGATLAQLPLPGESMPTVAFDGSGGRLFILRSAASVAATGAGATSPGSTSPGAASTGVAYQTALDAYDVATGVLTRVADVSQASGITAYPSELLVVADRPFVSIGQAVFEIDVASGGVSRVSGAGETVLGNVIGRVTPVGLRLAYIKSEAVAEGGITRYVKQLIATTVLP